MGEDLASASEGSLESPCSGSVSVDSRNKEGKGDSLPSELVEVCSEFLMAVYLSCIKQE